MGLLGDNLVLLLVEVFFRRSIGEFIGGFFEFLDVQTALVVEFYGVIYMLWRKLKG